MELGDYLKSINSDKNDLMSDEEHSIEAEKDYKPYIINRCLSSFPDTIFHAQEMNLRGFLDNKLQYDYLLHSIRKRKRFSPWLRAEAIDNLEAVKEYFGFNNNKAKDAIRILTEDQIEYIKEKLIKGGLKNK